MVTLMRLKSVLLGAAIAVCAASASDATTLQLGAGKSGDALGVSVKKEHGVTVYRAAPLPKEPTPKVVRKIIERHVIVEKRVIWPVKHLRTTGFYSGQGHTRRFTQGFYSGPPDLSSCD